MAEFNKKEVVAVIGPTASGKTAFAIRLAKQFNGEIVSLDSMQIYKYLNIGTAKPDIEEMQGIPHHMLDFVDPREPFSASDYGVKAKEICMDILLRGKLPIICGGTGLYLDALLYDYNMSETAANEELRKKLFAQAVEKGNQYLHDRLRELDPQSAEEIHPNNVKRVVRALEINILTGKTRAEQMTSSKEPLFSSLIFGIEWEREVLYERINRRVDVMFEQGLENEVRTLVERGILSKDTSTQASQAIGYKEVIDYLNGNITLDEAKEQIKMNSRRYAKRQLTWFKRNEEIHWINAHKTDAFDNAVIETENFLKEEMK